MTNQNEEIFREKFYVAYCEAWGLIKDFRDGEHDQEVYNKWLQTCCDFPKKYGNTEVTQSISRVMMDAGDIIIRLAEQERKLNQTIDVDTPFTPQGETM